MASKTSLMIYARSLVNSVGMENGSVKNWQLLKDVYDQGLENPPDWETDTGNGTNLSAIKSGKWLRKDGVFGGTTHDFQGIAWCGIFATYCLRAIGLPVHWRQNVGFSPLAPHLKIHSYLEAHKIEPGDICVKGKNQHHFIVLERNGDNLKSCDGNLPGQSIGQRTYNIKELIKEAKAQYDYDKSLPGKISKILEPNQSKFSFYFYSLQ